MSSKDIGQSVRRVGLAAVLLIVLGGLSPAFGVGGGVDLGYVPGQIVVKLRPGFGASDADSVAAAAGAVVREPLPVEGWYHLVAIDTATTVVEMRDALSADARVADAEPNYRCRLAAEPNDPYYAQQWYLPFINMPAAWETAYVRDASNVRVAVVDSCFRTNHPDLGGRFVDPYDAADGDTDPNPPAEARPWSEHGTAVAGVIGAVTDNGAGVAGMCWGGVQIIPIKTWKDSNTGEGGEQTDVIKGLDEALKRNAQVVNISLGSDLASDVYQEKIAELAAAGIIIVAAAGNDSGSVDYPAAYPETICVSGVDRNSDIADFSSRGPEVDLAAPAEGIFTTGLDMNTTPPGYYLSMDGTSFACPQVAAAAAILLANGRAPLTVRAVLEATARARGTGIPNSLYGYGILDVGAALLYQSFSVSIDRPQNGDRLATSKPSIRISLVGAALGSVLVLVDGETAISGGQVANAKVSNFSAPTTSGQMAFSWPFATGTHRVTATASAVYNSSVTQTATTTFYVGPRLLPAGMYLFSVPFAPLSTQTALSDVVTAADGSMLSVYRQARWDPESGSYRLFNYPGIPSDFGASLQPADVRAGEGALPAEGVASVTLPRGVGYWLDLRQDAVLMSSTYVDDGRSYAIELTRGWNQIGNPFPFPVGWGSVLVSYLNETVSITDAVSRGWISSSLFSYEAGAYRAVAAPSGLLDPWKGYWVLVKVPPTGAVPSDLDDPTAKVTLIIPPLQGALAGQMALAGGTMAASSKGASSAAKASGAAAKVRLSGR